MRLIKVIFASVIISIIISLFGSLIISLFVSLLNYIPLSKREPDIYYFSIGESLIFGMLYITPILFLVSIIAFIIYILIGKIKRFSHLTNVLLSILISGTITSLTIFVIDKNNETDDIYLIPKGFEGDVFAFYNIKGAPMVETENGYEVHVINEKGYFVTSKPDMDYGTVTDKYYYVDEKGDRTPINNKCVSLFGTLGFSTFDDDEEIDLNYTGFKLTKDKCSDEFMTESNGAEESQEEIIREILKHYYGVEQ